MKLAVTTFFILILVSILTNSCRKEKVETESGLKTNSKITLNHYQNNSETRAEFETGLLWCFSYLGAQLQKGSWQKSTNWLNNQKVELDISQLGFNENAQNQLKKLITIYKQSEEYKITGGMDAGRFVMSIYNNSNHYYKIVGIPQRLNSFTNEYNLLQRKAAIIESGVAFSERIIHLPQTDGSINSLGYLAEEITGSLIDSTDVVKESEVMDIMANGQLRFAIYNKNEDLVGGGDVTLSIAGKPAKCLWCHEVNIQTAIAALTEIPGYYTPSQFDSVILKNRATIEGYRASLTPEVVFNDNSQHVELEKLYFRFLEPSAKRLAAEWSLTEQEVRLKLASLTTHIHDEFTELGDLYYRAEVAPFSPYEVVATTTSARETTANEPNLLP